MNKRKDASGPKHVSGKHCGYTLFPDGSIQPAPRYIDEFKNLANEEGGVVSLLNSVMDHCARLKTEIARKRSDLWDRMADDYSLDRDTHRFSLNFYTSRLSATPIQKEDVEP